MTLKLPEKNLAAIILLTAFLTACGGGGDSDNSANDVTPEPTAPAASPDDTSTDKPDNVASDNEAQAALIASNTFSLARTSCGLGGLSADTALDNIAIQHAKYIKHVFANSTPTTFSPHYENKIADIANVTGDNNPFFRGVSFTDRLLQAKYGNARYGVTENIAQSVYYSSVGNIIGSDIMAGSMAK